MEHSADALSFNKIMLGTVEIYVTDYTLSKKSDLNYQPVISGGYASYEQGPYLSELIIKGKVLMDGVNPGPVLTEKMVNKTKFFFSLDGIYYTAAGIMNLTVSRNIRGKYYEITLRMVCNGVAEAQE